MKSNKWSVDITVKGEDIDCTVQYNISEDELEINVITADDGRDIDFDELTPTEQGWLREAIKDYEADCYESGLEEYGCLLAERKKEMRRL